jgi:VCBS repeat-containing protein
MGFPLPTTGEVTEDTGIVGGYLINNGDLNYLFGDDTGEWDAETITGAYGSQLTIDANGVWNYQADNSNGAIQALNTGDTLTEVFNVSSDGGNTTITITIQGQDEPPCFVEGSLIDTPHGSRAIESLSIGDEVLTRDNGIQKISWVGARKIKLNGLPECDNLIPVRICAGALGPNVPDRDLLVSPMHRVLLTNPAVQLMTGDSEIFCAAKHLVNGHSIRYEYALDVTYLHLLFEDHQIVTSANCMSESLYPGKIALNGFVDESREEVFAIFPRLRLLPETYGDTARQVLKGFEAKLIRETLIEEPSFLSRSGTTRRLVG